MKILGFVASLVVPLTGYATTIELDTYLGGRQTQLDGKPALAFIFSHNAKLNNEISGSGSSSNNCSIITTDQYLRQSKGRLENINLTEPNFYFDCEWEGKFYMLSNHYRTYAEVIVKPPDANFPMSIHIEAKLVTLSGERLEVISGDIPLSSENERVW